MSVHSRCAVGRLITGFPAIAATIFVSTFVAQAQDAGAFHEVETKYIFGNFTVGSSTGIEGEKAFEPETEANFGKGAADIMVSAKPRLNMNIRQRNTCRSYLVRPCPITTSTAFQVSTTATWRQLTASRLSFALS